MRVPARRETYLHQWVALFLSVAGSDWTGAASTNGASGACLASVTCGHGTVGGAFLRVLPHE